MTISRRLCHFCRHLPGRIRWTLIIIFIYVANDVHSGKFVRYSAGSRRLMRLVEESPLLIPREQSKQIRYVSEALPIYIIWYGNFSDTQKSIVRDFFDSFDSRNSRPWTPTSPSVRNWWKPTGSYFIDPQGTHIRPQVQLESEMSDFHYSIGKRLSNTNVQELVSVSLETFELEANPKGFYLVLTSEDVAVEGFCVKSCGSRGHVAANFNKIQGLVINDDFKEGERVYHFAWVGNSAEQCVRKCAWPLAQPDLEHGPSKGPLLSPNNDVGMDGMIVHIAAMLAEAATMNSFDTAFYQRDDAGSLVDTATACMGVFGEGAYPGYPGHLWKEKLTGISFNAFGANDRKFLLPALWDTETLKCRIPS